MRALDLLVDEFPHGTKDYSFRKATPAAPLFRSLRMKPQRVSREPTKPREPRPIRESKPVQPVRVEDIQHGTVAGYEAGCFTTGCPTSPSCAEVNLAKRGPMASRHRHAKNVAAPVLHGTLTMFLRGCRSECSASPSCAEVGVQFYAGRAAGRVRKVKPHGTNACYVRGCRRPECVEAHRQYHRDYVLAKRQLADAGHHGTAYGYQLGCRGECPESPSCTDVMLAKDKLRPGRAGRAKRGPLVDSGPVRDHIVSLRSAGLSIVEIIDAAGVSRKFVHTLIYGRPGGARGGQIPARVDAEKASLILAVRA